MYMVITAVEGARVNDNGNKGLDEAVAEADAKVRNKRAGDLGIKTRYEAAAFVKA
jgi:hypothetical protein